MQLFINVNGTQIFVDGNTIYFEYGDHVLRYDTNGPRSQTMLMHLKDGVIDVNDIIGHSQEYGYWDGMYVLDDRGARKAWNIDYIVIEHDGTARKATATRFYPSGETNGAVRAQAEAGIRSNGYDAYVTRVSPQPDFSD